MSKAAEIPYKDVPSFVTYLKKLHQDLNRQFNQASQTQSIKWRLVRIEEALKFLENNSSYEIGTCASCQAPISKKRILIDPAVIWCAECVQAEEKKNPHKGVHWFASPTARKNLR